MVTRAPETSEDLMDMLSTPEKAAAAMADQAKWKDTLRGYIKNFAENDSELQQQAKESQERVMKEFLISQGYEPKDVKRLPMSDDIIETDSIAPGASMNGQFKSFGEFCRTSWFKNIQRLGMDTRLKNLGESQGDQGGFLVPEEFRMELLRMSLEASLVRPRARVVPMGGLTLSYPAIKDTTHASTVFGGVTAQWVAEGADLSSGTNEPTFAQAVLTAKKLTGYTVVSNELMQDAAISIESVLMQLFGEAIPWFEDDAFIAGVGGGQPLGVLNADATISVTKETGQAAATIVWENVVKMFARMLPQSIGSGVWYAHIDTFPQLVVMSLSVGTGGAPVWINNGVAGPPATILGRPVFFTEKAETLGTAGDITFADFSYYLIGDRQAMTVESSPHVQFINDRTVWKFVQRVDGRPWIDSALTPRKGTATMSPFVQLATRS